MSKHTPGPWTAGNVGVIWAPDENRRLIVARVGAFQDREVLHFSRKRWTADARLIAAAPDLLAALTGMKCWSCLHELSDPWPDYATPCVHCAPAISAIAAARGEAQP